MFSVTIPAVNLLLRTSVGAMVTLVLLIFPALFASGWRRAALSGWDLAMIALPFGVLALSLVSRSRWLSLLVFPLAHVPAMVALPALGNGSAHGASRPLALAVAFAVLVAWFVLSTRATSEASSPDDTTRFVERHPLFVGTGLLSLAILAALVVGALRLPQEVAPGSLNIVLVTATVSIWFLIGGVLLPRLGRVMLEPREVGRARTALWLRRRPPGRMALVAVVAAGIAILLAMFWYATPWVRGL